MGHLLIYEIKRILSHMKFLKNDTAGQAHTGNVLVQVLCTLCFRTSFLLMQMRGSAVSRRPGWISWPLTLAWSWLL